MNSCHPLALVLLISIFSQSVAVSADAQRSTEAIEQLKVFLMQPRDARPAIALQPFAAVALTQADAVKAEKALWDDHAAHIRQTRSEEMKAGEIRLGDKVMKFVIKSFGEKPAGGRSLLFSMHGGGNAPPAVNDRQWANQQKLYELEEGLYLAPRAPTNTWNLWHEGHIDAMFDRLIENLIVLEDVNPNRVFLTGYSAGGDGVYQLAPRMADRFAAAAMMAGHPNEASPLGLRNLPMAIHVGEKDTPYNRNKVAGDWGLKLDELRKSDPDGYLHECKLHAGKGHWMDREDAEALPWMAKFTRMPFPKKVIWHQDDVTHHRFYWLALNDGDAKVGQDLSATLSGQTIDLRAPVGLTVRIRLNDRMLDLEKPVQISLNGLELAPQKAERTVAILAKTLAERGDPQAVFQAELVAQGAKAD